MKLRKTSIFLTALPLGLIGCFQTIKEDNFIEKEDKRPQTRTANTDLYGDPLPPGAILRMGSIRFRQGTEVSGLGVSDDGKILVSLGKSNVPNFMSVRFWDILTGRQISGISPPKPEFKAFSFSPDGKYIAAAFPDGLLRVWELANRREIFKAQVPPGEIKSMAFSWDGKKLAVVFGGIHKFGTYQVLLYAGKTIARVYDLVSKGRIWTFECANCYDYDLSFSPDGKILAIAYYGNVYLWDLDTGKTRAKISGGGGYSHCLFSPEGRTLVTRKAVNKDYRNSFWNATNPEAIREIHVDESLRIGAIFSPDGKTLAIQSLADQDPFCLRDLATGRELIRLNGNDSMVRSLVFSRDGNLLITGHENGKLLIWDIQGGIQIREFPGHYEAANCVTFSPDGNMLATGGNEGLIYLWDSRTSKPIMKIEADKGRVSSVAFSPDGKTLASASQAGRRDYEHDFCVRLWDVQFGKEIFKWGLENKINNPVVAVRFSLDGKRVFARTLDSKIWELNVVLGTRAEYFPETGNLEMTFAPNDGEKHSWLSRWIVSPDRRTLATIIEGAYNSPTHCYIQFTDLLTGEKCPVSFSIEKSYQALAFSLDGRYLAAGNGRGEIKLWDTANGDLISKFNAHGNIQCLAFSPDGKRLASGNLDSSILIWDLENLKNANVN